MHFSVAVIAVSVKPSIVIVFSSTHMTLWPLPRFCTPVTLPNAGVMSTSVEFLDDKLVVSKNAIG